MPRKKFVSLKNIFCGIGYAVNVTEPEVRLVPSHENPYFLRFIQVLFICLQNRTLKVLNQGGYLVTELQLEPELYLIYFRFTQA